MKSYIQPGDTLPLTAPYNVTSGAGFLVGSIFAVATTTVLSGAPVEGKVEGVFELKKTSAQAWTLGARIYWDDVAKECTTTVGSNKLIGVATEVAVNPSSVGRVRLSGAFTL